MTPAELLAYAQQLLRGLGDTTSGNASRLAAVVARQALAQLRGVRAFALREVCAFEVLSLHFECQESHLQQRPLFLCHATNR